MYSQEKLSEARECLCVLVLGTQTSLFAKREMDNLTWRLEKREPGSAKSQEESRQRKCAMMISL